MTQELIALNLPDEQLALLSEITEQDIILANGDIAKAVDKRFKNLVLAIDGELAAMEKENESES